MKKIVGSIVILSSLVLASAVQAEGQGIDTKNLYFGGGFGFNNVPGYGSARGFQFFGGYELNGKINEDITTSVELGYMDSGNFDSYNGFGKGDDAKGLWAAAVESVPLSSKTDMLVRLGYDFGDDDGLLMGTGLQYKFNTKAAFRMEYVARENVNGLQANVLFKF